MHFSLFANETSGVWGEHALELVTEIARRAEHCLSRPLAVDRFPGNSTPGNFALN